MQSSEKQRKGVEQFLSNRNKASKDKFYLLMNPSRPMVTLFSGFIAEQYPLGTSIRQLIVEHRYKWLDTGKWIILRMPRNILPELQQLAKILGLELVNESPRLVPVAETTEGAELVRGTIYEVWFPGTRENPNIFTVKNCQKPRISDKISRERSLEVALELAYMPNSGKITPQQAADFIYGRSEALRIQE